MFGVTILGNNSALPAHDRHPTSQVVTLGSQVLMIDCGEGTQMQLSKYKIRRTRLNHIFISHLHGDHYFGLPGLITSLGLLGRENDLHVYGPEILSTIILPLLQVAEAHLPFQLIFHPLKEEGQVLNEDEFSVECFRVTHRIECWGFIIREKRKPRRINKATISQYDIPVTFYDRLKDGEDYLSPEGGTITNDKVTIPNNPGRSYAYCADTIYDENNARKIKDVTMVYHETTYLKALETKAAERFHSTSVQAAKIAQLANAKHLLIGHFSSKYETLDEFLIEARSVFPDTQLAEEGVTFFI